MRMMSVEDFVINQLRKPKMQNVAAGRLHVETLRYSTADGRAPGESAVCTIEEEISAGLG